MVVDFDLLARIGGIGLTTCALLAILWKIVVLPNLRSEFAPSQKLAAQVEETHRQVTVNHHSSEKPTVLDQIDDLRSDLSDMQGMLVQSLGNQVTILGEFRTFSDKTRAHDAWSTEEAAKIWAAIDELKSDGPGDT